MKKIVCVSGKIVDLVSSAEGGEAAAMVSPAKASKVRVKVKGDGLSANVYVTLAEAEAMRLGQLAYISLELYEIAQ